MDPQALGTGGDNIVAPERRARFLLLPLFFSCFY